MRGSWGVPAIRIPNLDAPIQGLLHFCIETLRESFGCSVVAGDQRTDGELKAKAPIYKLPFGGFSQ